MDLYFIEPEHLPEAVSPPPEVRQRPESNPNFGASAYARNTHHGLDDWRNISSKVINKQRIEEFEHRVVIAKNQPNLESDLRNKPEGTYIICYNNNKNMAYPFTMYRCTQGNFGRSQVIKTNIRFDLVRKTFQAEGYGNNHPSLRALVDANQSILKREFHETYVNVP